MRMGDWKIMGRLEVDDKTLPNIHNLYDGNEAFVKSAKLTDFQLFNMKEDQKELQDLSLKELEVFNEIKKEFEIQYKELLDGSHVWVREN